VGSMGAIHHAERGWHLQADPPALASMGVLSKWKTTGSDP